MQKRTFTVLKVKSGNKTLRFKGGRYTGEPARVAEKMAKQACKNQKSCTNLLITFQETTKGKSNQYQYMVKRKKITPLTYYITNGKTKKPIVVKFSYEAVQKKLKTNHS